MADVFISYASEDRDRARKLASALETHGWSVWWDRNIIPGQTFDQVIEHELDTAKSVIVLWSKNSIASEWVKNEASVATERGVLVPALIDSVQLPLEFRRRQTADLVGWEGDPSNGGFQALCDGISARASITGVAPHPSTAPRQPKFRWHRGWTLGAIAAIAMVLAVGAYWAFTRAPQHQDAVVAPQRQAAVKPSLSGTWDLNQIFENQQRHYGSLELTQKGARLTGKLVWKTIHPEGEVVDGMVEGDRVRFIVKYSDVLKGVYEGTIDESGDRLDGSTKGGGTYADWFAKRK